MLAEMRDAGARAVAMEVSSHALALAPRRRRALSRRRADERHPRPPRLSRHARSATSPRSGGCSTSRRTRCSTSTIRSARTFARRARDGDDVRDRTRRRNCARPTSCCAATAARFDVGRLHVEIALARALQRRQRARGDRRRARARASTTTRSCAAWPRCARCPGRMERIGAFGDRRDRRLRAHARRARQRAARGARNDARPADRGVRLRRRPRSRASASRWAASPPTLADARDRHLGQPAQRGSGGDRRGRRRGDRAPR